MALLCVPLNAAVEGSSEKLHLELIKAMNYRFVYPAAKAWSALSKEKPVERVLESVFLKSCKCCEFMSP